MLTRQEFLTHLRQALNHLYEPDRLRQNPLVALFGVANRPDAFSAMQNILIEAIEALDPRSDEPRQSQAWELRELLSYHYLQQMTQQQVARQLGMSVRDLRRKEHATWPSCLSHEFTRNGTAKLLTLFHPADGEGRAKGVGTLRRGRTLVVYLEAWPGMPMSGTQQ